MVFKAQGPHAWALMAVPLGIISIAGGVAVANVMTLLLVPFGLCCLVSTAYGRWGVLELSRHYSTWTMVWRLGSFSRRRLFDADRIRSVEVITWREDWDYPSVGAFPGTCGRRINVYFTGEDRPLPVAEGLCLSKEVLDEIATRLRRAT